jgi:hypothetical protein
LSASVGDVDRQRDTPVLHYGGGPGKPLPIISEPRPPVRERSKLGY